MFDGADLSAVYGTPTYDNKPMVQSMSQQPIMQPTQVPQQIGVNNPHVVDANAYGKATTSHSTPVDTSYAPPNEAYAQQLPHPKSYGGDTFWDKIGNKKAEVIKMFILSLVVVLGLSVDRVAGHYLDGYITKSILTNVQEIMVRISYPVGILLLIWIIKAAM